MKFLQTAAVLFAVGIVLGAGPVRVDDDVELLREHGVEATPSSLSDFLHALHPSKPMRQRIATLVVQLGDNDFFKREEATRELVRLPILSTDQLANAAESHDPEIRWEARYVLRQSDRQSGLLLHAAFRVIEKQEIKGLAQPVLEALPLCAEEKHQHVRQAGQRALIATASPDDAPLLRDALSHDRLRIREAAMTALEAHLGSRSDADLEPLLNDSLDPIRVAAARALANHGHRGALKTLIRLLDSDEIQVRVRAVQTLRAATGEQFQYVAYETADERQDAVELWAAWMEQHGPTAKLRTPLPESEFMLGRTLICYYSGNKVVELDAQGKEVWSQNVPGAFGCHGLPNGHRLIASYTGKQVVEYNAQGKEIWKVDSIPGRPFNVRRLQNGRTLVACYDTGKIVEVTPDKTIAWTIRLAGRPMDARRLPNGNTLVALYQSRRVVEVDRSGNVVWEIADLSGPRSAQRLDNGNTLVCLTSVGKVVEYNRAGKVVWSTKKRLSNLMDAQRLPNGHTLLIDSSGLQELDHEGEAVWHKAGSGAGRVWRY